MNMSDEEWEKLFPIPRTNGWKQLRGLIVMTALCTPIMLLAVPLSLVAEYLPTGSTDSDSYYSSLVDR